MPSTSLPFYVHLAISLLALFQSSFSCHAFGLPCVTLHCSSQSATLSEDSNFGHRTSTRWLRKGYSSKNVENLQDPFQVEKNANKLEVKREYFSVQHKLSRSPHGRMRKSMKKASCKFNCSVTTSNTRKIRLGKRHDTLKTTSKTIGKFNTSYARNIRSHFTNTDRTSRRSEQKLQTIQTVLVVSKDGRPDHFPSIQSAVDAVPMWNYVAWIIYIEPGWYREAVVVPQGKDYITFLGGGAENTVIVNNRNASEIGPNGTEYGILDCASVIIEGSHFTAKGITFMNESPKPSEMDFNSQAPAIRISGDKCAFYRYVHENVERFTVSAA